MFKDCKGRKFEGKIVLPTAVELKAIDVDLGDELPKVLEAITADPAKLGQVLYLVHRESAEQHKVSAEEFGGLMDGDVLPEACDSLTDAIINFSRPSTRKALRNLIEKSKEAEELVGNELTTLSKQVTAEAIIAQLKSEHGSSPASSESTFDSTTAGTDASVSGNSTGPQEPNDATSGTDSAR